MIIDRSFFHHVHVIMLPLCDQGIEPTKSQSEMFHPPKIPQRQRNGNGTRFQWVPVENSLNADVEPIADPFFQPLLAVVGRCWFNGRC